ncbi:N2 N2-dimethylguanosine tRNA methyltransferase [Mycena maculata]|uniref:tRNA (guanine(26)-N(2))-dimethyltransferase n=1 Tax=Mycena maculata TaxID=230809 RepID=A0AAD7K0J3_9AGAR|nr:N2 N2-dimethylguanosine tRNA methyltransferase [Mycena maculata]
MATKNITIPEIPEGFTLHTENNSHILLSSNEAFLNPVQEFNRDTSVACIRVWSEELHRLKKEKWLLARERKQTKKKQNKRPRLETDVSVDTPESVPQGTEPESVSVDQPEYPQRKIVILEALSATGLRSIRYAKEIPHVSYVIANDLSSAATAAMKRNIDLNGLGPLPPASGTDPAAASTRPTEIRVNEGDACTLMYNHRENTKRVDVLDLDPYGTAAPFIDAAVQCIRDDGLLCVTCTDLTVLATTNYAEKCFSNYGGIPVKAEYCHEAALRLVLHSISTSAARYGRYIEPILSLSIDFYVRLFIRIRTSPLEVKKAITKTSTYWVCTDCQSFYGQPMAKVTEKAHPSGAVNYNFKLQPGPPVMDKCPECEGTLHMAGPMWSAPIHDSGFVGKVLEHLASNETLYGTASRMKGMLTVAKEELPDTPFYFTPTRVANFFHCSTPSLADVASALLHGGHKVSRSHASAGSIKSTATRAEVFDIFRCWIKLNPVKRANISPTSPAHRLLEKEPRVEANFTKHPDSVAHTSKVKLVRYQENPTANWGPGTKAVSGTSAPKSTKAAKRKHEHVEDAEEQAGD